jgi:hypothetical protein
VTVHSDHRRERRSSRYMSTRKAAGALVSTL